MRQAAVRASILIDAEVCVLDGEGQVPEFQRLQKRAQLSKRVSRSSAVTVEQPIAVLLRSTCWSSAATTCAACRWSSASALLRKVLLGGAGVLQATADHVEERRQGVLRPGGGQSMKP